MPKESPPRLVNVSDSASRSQAQVSLRSDRSIKENCREASLDPINLCWAIAALPELAGDGFQEIRFGDASAELGFLDRATENLFINPLEVGQCEAWRQQVNRQ